MRTNRLLSLVGLSVLVLACDRAPTEVQAPVATPRALWEWKDNYWTSEYSGWVTACNGDPVYLDVKYHWTDKWGSHGDGSWWYTQHINGAGKSTGPNGDTYTFTFEQTYSDAGTWPAWERQYKLHWRAIGKGPLENQKYTAIFDYVVDENGNVTKSIDEVEAECR